LIELLNEEAPTYGYADDIAVLCRDLMQTRRVIKIVDRWGKANGLLLNKKKCGILIHNT
jgi:hypothetical protein